MCERHMTHIQHIFEQGERIHGEVAERVLHDPSIGPSIPLLLKQRNQRRVFGPSHLRITGPHEQQSLS